MSTLRIYVSAACASCITAYTLAERLRRVRPQQPVDLIDLDRAGVVRPPYVFGTPTYCVGDQVISLGNPSLSALLAALDCIYS